MFSLTRSVWVNSVIVPGADADDTHAQVQRAGAPTRSPRRFILGTACRDMLSLMPAADKTPRKPAKRKPAGKASSKGSPGRSSAVSSKRGAEEAGFPEAFAALLRERKLAVPSGLADAPPEAYASQPASFVEQLGRLPDQELRRYAEQVGGYAERQAARAAAEWDRSPLIAELRRRKLKEPPRPLRAAGVSASLAKPLAEWSDKELLDAATRWSRIGRS